LKESGGENIVKSFSFLQVDEAVAVLQAHQGKPNEA
jgi:hypothetical protein